MTRIVTDSTSLVHPEHPEFPLVDSAPLTVFVEGNTYRDLAEIDSRMFTEMLDREAIATSSQPPAGEFKRIYEEYPEDEIVVITLTQRLSGTYESAHTAKTQVENSDRITIIDSETLGAPLYEMVRRASAMAQAGEMASAIENMVNRLKKVTRSYLAPTDFDFLMRGGRLSSRVASIGKVLRAIPILTLGENGGKLEVHGVKLGWPGVVSSIMKGLENAREGAPWKHFILHDRQEDAAQRMRESILKRDPDAEIMTRELSPLLLTHSGPKAFVVQSILDLDRA